MAMDQDVNSATFMLHLGTTLPFWDRAVRIQLSRIQPLQDWVVRVNAAAKRLESGTGSSEDEALIGEAKDVVARRSMADIDPFPYGMQIRIDGVFLLLAIRSILTMADRIVTQLEPLGKAGEAIAARDAFTSRYGLVKDLRDVVIHYDEYVVGQGRRRDLIVDPNQGAGVTDDVDGYLIFAWAGHRIRLVDAAKEALVLSESLARMFGKAVFGTR
ncbi:hypothetical protein J5X84_44170 [Streptosporangiaceae bacterium NEAU-GS5]|nr:hypothetical protein [Streptosporangiaceae bacterium NEAU-GS5]